MVDVPFRAEDLKFLRPVWWSIVGSQYFRYAMKSKLDLQQYDDGSAFCVLQLIDFNELSVIIY